jgi:UDP-3-O-[3-hydroxymyristoyl] glucosamine N-acyltransferase
VVIQEHTHVNIGTTIGHNCVIGRYNTISPSVNISGNVTTGSFVYLGTNSAIREKITITANTTVGMCSAVIRDIKQSGTYVGVPAKQVK